MTGPGLGAVAVTIRDARDEDGWDLSALIAACWAEYPGCVFDLHGELPHLQAIAGHFARMGGNAWVAEQGRRLVGSVAVVPAADGTAELRMLYVARPARKAGLGATLVGLVEDWARRHGCDTVRLWSDTRFTDAHRLYDRLGYVQSGTRELGDLSGTVEFGFSRLVCQDPPPPLGA